MQQDNVLQSLEIAQNPSLNEKCSFSIQEIILPMNQPQYLKDHEKMYKSSQNPEYPQVQSDMVPVLPEEQLRAQQEAMRASSNEINHPLQEVEIPYTEVQNLQNI